LDDRKSQRSQSAYSRVSGRSNRSGGGLSAAGLNALNAETRSSAKHAAEDARSNVSRRSGAVSVGRRSYVSSAKSKDPSVAYSEINENDEWVAI